MLDANLSPRRIGDPLRSGGHDVRAIAEEPELDGCEDDELLAIATADERILVTRNGRDFSPITQRWAEAGREHAGVILIWTLSTRQYGELIAGIERRLEAVPAHTDWRGLVVAI